MNSSIVWLMAIYRVEVLEMLRRKQGKRSLRAFARDIGVSAPYLSDVLRGNRDPGPTLLKVLGLERVRTVSLVYERRKA
jgi:transcriptional regulator with XRE-family HTH domain